MLSFKKKKNSALSRPSFVLGATQSLNLYWLRGGRK